MKLFDGFKLLFLPDLHIKTLPTRTGWQADVSPALWSALDFGDHFKPDMTIIGGDFLDFGIISPLTDKDLLYREGKRLLHDFELGNQILDRIDKFSKGKKIFLIGNHDTRLATWIASNPQLEGLIGLTYNLGLEKRGYEVLAEGRTYKIGHARFVHGWYWTMHHAKKTVTEMGDNIFYGHVHDVQSFCKANPEQMPIIGQSCGCLCELNPEWKKNRPNRWVNSFAIFYFFANGDFTYYLPIVISGKFIWNGRIFGGK